MGQVIAVCKSDKAGIPKIPVQFAVIAEFGLEGDYHCKPMRRDFNNHGSEVPNVDRHILIVAKEALDAVNNELGISLKAGDLGENILIEGEGDLSDVQPGATVFTEHGIEFEVVKQNKPCGNVAHYHPLFNKTIYSPQKPRRGLLCRVKRGIGKPIRTGHGIVIL